MTRDINEENGEYQKFYKIQGHKQTKQNHKGYCGSSYNLRIVGGNREILEVPLNKFADNTLVECAVYARQNDVVNKPGWKRFQRLEACQRSWYVWSTKYISKYFVAHPNKVLCGLKSSGLCFNELFEKHLLYWICLVQV